MRVLHPGHDTGRVDTGRRRFLDEGNLDLATPLEWTMHGTRCEVA
ncbi:hypothetical protein [Streptomyces marokkonensis]